MSVAQGLPAPGIVSHHRLLRNVINQTTSHNRVKETDLLWAQRDREKTEARKLSEHDRRKFSKRMSRGPLYRRSRSRSASNSDRDSVDYSKVREVNARLRVMRKEARERALGSVEEPIIPTDTEADQSVWHQYSDSDRQSMSPSPPAVLGCQKPAIFIESSSEESPVTLISRKRKKDRKKRSHRKRKKRKKKSKMILNSPDLEWYSDDIQSDATEVQGCEKPESLKKSVIILSDSSSDSVKIREKKYKKSRKHGKRRSLRTFDTVKSSSEWSSAE
eukprot:191495_1